MTEVVKTEKGSLWKELQNTRGILAATRRSFEDQRSIRDAVYKDSLVAALSTRQKAVKALKDKADQKKAEHKAVYDSVKDTAQRRYELALAAVQLEYDEAIEAAHAAKESEYRKINELLDFESAPILVNHRDEVQALTSKHEDEMENFLKSGEREIRDLQERVRNLETELAAKTAQTAKPMSLEESSAA